MTLSVFSLSVDFAPAGPPMIFRSSAAAELGRTALADAALEQLRRHPFCRFAPRMIPSLLKLHWLKSTFARKSASVILCATQ